MGSGYEGSLEQIAHRRRLRGRAMKREIKFKTSGSKVTDCDEAAARIAAAEFGDVYEMTAWPAEPLMRMTETQQVLVWERSYRASEVEA